MRHSNLDRAINSGGISRPMSQPCARPLASHEPTTGRSRVRGRPGCSRRSAGQRSPAWSRVKPQDVRNNASSRPIAQLAISKAGSTSLCLAAASMRTIVLGRKWRRP